MDATAQPGDWKIRLTNLRRWAYEHRHDLIAVGVLLAVSLVLFYVFRRDPTTTDDRRDFILGRKVLKGLRGAKHYDLGHFRMGWLTQIALAQAVFGATSRAYYAVPIFHSLLTVGGVYFLVRQFFPLTVAFCVALILATSPYFLAFSSWLFVDWAVASVFVIGLAFTVLAARADEQLPEASRLRFARAAGVFLWLAWWTKLTIVPMLPFVFCLLVVVPRDRTTWRAVGVAVQMFAILVGFELLYNWLWLGSPLLPFGVVAHAQTSEYAQTELIARGKVAADLSWQDLFWRYPERFWNLGPGRIFLLLSGIGAVTALVTRHRVLLWLLAMALAYWAAISLMVNSTDPLVYVLRTKFRYFAPAFVLLMIVGTAWPYVLWERFSFRIGVAGKRLWAGAAVAAVVLLVGYHLRFEIRHPITYGFGRVSTWDDERMYRKIRGIVSGGTENETQPVKRVISDYRNLSNIRLFVRRSHGVEFVAMDGSRAWKMTPEDFRAGDLVFVDRSRLTRNKQLFKSEVPRFIDDPPGNWDEIWHSPPSEDGLGDKSGGDKLYYIRALGGLEAQQMEWTLGIRSGLYERELTGITAGFGNSSDCTQSGPPPIGIFNWFWNS